MAMESQEYPGLVHARMCSSHVEILTTPLALALPHVCLIKAPYLPPFSFDTSYYAVLPAWLEAGTEHEAVSGAFRMHRRYRRHLLLLALLCSLSLAVADTDAQMVQVKGAGASFPCPLYGR